MGSTSEGDKWGRNQNSELVLEELKEERRPADSRARVVFADLQVTKCASLWVTVLNATELHLFIKYLALSLPNIDHRV